METITIPYDDYKMLIENKERFVSIATDISYIIYKSDLDYYKQNLNFEFQYLRDFVVKYFSYEYNKRLEELQEKAKKEDLEKKEEN